MNNTIQIITPNKNYQIDINNKGEKYRALSLCQITNGNLVPFTGTPSSKIRIWSITKSKFKCLFTMDFFSEVMISLDNNKVASSYYKKYIEVLNMEKPYNSYPIKIYEKLTDYV